jgi:hypothetical protein
MVLHRKEAALEYRRLLDVFGMEYSNEKSLYPSEDANTAEIAKRYFRNGLDISPIPPKVLLESTKNLEGYFEFLEILASRTNSPGGDPTVDWSEAINLIWKSNKDYGSETAHAVLACPINGYFQFLDRNREMLMLLTELKVSWDISRVSLIKNTLDRFMLNEATEQLNKTKMVLDVSMEAAGISQPCQVRGPTDLRSSPLVEEYLSVKRREILKLVRTWVGNQMTGSFDDSSPTRTKSSLETLDMSMDSIQLIEYLQSETDPNSPQDFMEKRRIRRKRGLGIIQRFWTRNKGVISTPNPISK